MGSEAAAVAARSRRQTARALTRGGSVIVTDGESVPQADVDAGRTGPALLGRLLFAKFAADPLLCGFLRAVLLTT